MQTITLKPREVFRTSVEAENISPDKFAGKTVSEIEALEAWIGNTRTTLGKLFNIKVEGSAAPQETKIVIDGSIARIKRVGEAMSAGIILINGNVDMHLGAKMSGGAITVKGNVDSWLGREMKGGEILVEGNAGYYVGSGYRGESCGMRGGKITVLGSTLDFLGEHMCGGEINVRGNVGIMPGVSNNGGKIVIEGNTTMPGSEMLKGTIIIKGKVEEMVPVFKSEGTEAVEGVTYRKYTGDVVVNGKGVLYIK